MNLMRHVKDTTSFSTYAKAEKYLLTKLQEAGESPDEVRWLIIATPSGRFMPAVMFDQKSSLVTLALHSRVTILG
jgi:hypothetical protein